MTTQSGDPRERAFLIVGIPGRDCDQVSVIRIDEIDTLGGPLDPDGADRVASALRVASDLARQADRDRFSGSAVIVDLEIGADPEPGVGFDLEVGLEPESGVVLGVIAGSERDLPRAGRGIRFDVQVRDGDPA